jgi:ubiquinone biosynthesis accessory factor UbiJ
MLLEPIAALINRNIAASSRAKELCARLEGRALGVRVDGFLPLTIFARVEAGTLHLSRAASRDPDAAIAGTPLALAVLIGRDAAGRMRAGSVTITGDSEIAQTFHELLHAARPDLEEELSRLIGDVGAHQVGNFTRALADWGEKTATTFLQNVSEYLQEESRDLVTRTEADEFLAAVDGLRDAADRLAARIERLHGSSQ